MVRLYSLLDKVAKCLGARCKFWLTLGGQDSCMLSNIVISVFMMHILGVLGIKIKDKEIFMICWFHLYRTCQLLSACSVVQLLYMWSLIVSTLLFLWFVFLICIEFANYCQHVLSTYVVNQVGGNDKASHAKPYRLHPLVFMICWFLIVCIEFADACPCALSSSYCTFEALSFPRAVFFVIYWPLVTRLSVNVSVCLSCHVSVCVCLVTCTST